MKFGGEKEKLKEQTRVEIGSAASMGVDGESKEECGVGGSVFQQWQWAEEMRQ